MSARPPLCRIATPSLWMVTLFMRAIGFWRIADKTDALTPALRSCRTFSLVCAGNLHAVARDAISSAGGCYDRVFYQSRSTDFQFSWSSLRKVLRDNHNVQYIIFAHLGFGCPDARHFCHISIIIEYFHQCAFGKKSIVKMSKIWSLWMSSPEVGYMRSGERSMLCLDNRVSI